MLDVRRLRLLREVALCGSIAGAARTPSLTPPAVSQQLAKLEHEVRVALLARRRRRVSLTEAGRLLAGHAASILERLALAEAELRALAPSDGPLLLAALLRALRESASAYARRAHLRAVEASR